MTTPKEHLENKVNGRDCDCQSCLQCKELGVRGERRAVDELITAFRMMLETNPYGRNKMLIARAMFSFVAEDDELRMLFAMLSLRAMQLESETARAILNSKGQA